jgi:hypothetical protein
VGPLLFFALSAAAGTGSHAAVRQFKFRLNEWLNMCAFLCSMLGPSSYG